MKKILEEPKHQSSIVSHVSFAGSTKLDPSVKRPKNPANPPAKPWIEGRNCDEKKEVAFTRLMGVVGVGLGVIFYLLHKGAPTPEHTLLLQCHREQINCNVKEEIRSAMETLAVHRTRTVIGSWSWEECDLIEAAASSTGATVVSWDCPNSENDDQELNYRAIPKLTAIGAATVQTLKHLRFKSVSTLNLESGAWPQLKLVMENLLMKANITIRHSFKFKLRNYTTTEFSSILEALSNSSPVICLLVPVSWTEMNNLARALETVASNGRTVYFVMIHIVLRPGFAAYAEVLSPLLPSLIVLTVGSIQGLNVEFMLNSSLSVARNGWTNENRLVNKLTVSDWQRAANDTDRDGRWRSILEIPVPEDNNVEIDPLIEDSWNWAKTKADPFGYKSNNCDDIDCSDQGNQDVFNSILMAATSTTLVCLFLIGVSMVRRFYRQSKTARGQCKIILTPSDFIFPQVQEVKRVEEGIEAMLCCWLHQLQELGGPEVEKPDLIKGSVGSLKSTVKKSPSITSISKISSDPRARYNGDLVQLKLIPVNGTNFDLKSKTMEFLMMLHTLRHENINPIIGCLPDPTRPYIVWEYCSRGSLEDVLMADEIKLDWAFRLSLLTDLVRGMRYLHSSPAKLHGNLTSRNCVIDARWVLKITDYSLTTIYELQNIPCPVKKPKDLLWCAPEFLRDPQLRARGTQAGDVYSFGIVMQEVVVRGEPFCMLSLPPEEILEKIKKPPPLIRPSVSKGAAPPEAINIMRQCWAELPDMRPDFNTIYDLFKTLNQGRKGNIIDTMFQMLEKYSNNLEDLIRERTEQLDMEKKKTEQLLNRMLPSYVADKLKLGMPVDPEEFSEVTIYFSDIVGFTTISAYSTPFEVVDLLNDLYTTFDATINAYDVYKVETIGDAYMVVGGLPIRVRDHAQQIATMALDLLHHSGEFRIRHLPFTPLRLRIGLHTGPCCAGVVGLTMPRYCLFGDTVNTASRMESSGSAWRIHISESTKTKLEETGDYLIEKRGLTELKGKGRVMTYWLLGKVGFDKQLPTPPPIRESHGLDEQLVMYGRTGVMPSPSNDDKVEDEPLSELSPNKLAPSRPQSGRKLPIRRPVYQLSLDAGLLAATSGDDSGSRKRWQSSRQMTFDSTDDCKLESRKNGRGDGNPTINEPQRSNDVASPLSTSELNINSPGVSFINPSRSTQNLNGKYRKVDENDLSSQYNYYRCLSPNDGNSGSLQKASSSRFLRRQYSMDREDIAEGKGLRLFKQNSAGAANDLGRIDEVPVKSTVTSPQFGQNAIYKHRNVQSTTSSESLT